MSITKSHKFLEPALACHHSWCATLWKITRVTHANTISMQLRHCENSCMSHGACDHCNLNTISGICTKRSRSQLTCILLPLLLLRFTVLGLPFPFPLSATVPVPALDLHTITGRMRKQNLKYYSAPRDSVWNDDISFCS